MDAKELLEAASRGAMPEGLSPLLQAMFRDACGDWDGAHEIAQDIPSGDASRVHAYLHRKEGDLPNARYWYRRASVEEASGSLDAEWDAIVSALLQRDDG